MTDRERFLYRLPNTLVRHGDVAIVLCGEDAIPRMMRGYDLLADGSVPRILLSGGRDEPPAILSAQSVEPKLLSLGVVPSVITREDASRNTREQAENAIPLVRRHGWRWLALVASPYHLPRAYLTFLRSLLDAKLGDDVYLMPITADRTRFTEPPVGLTVSRGALLARELHKIDKYAARGHVAGYGEALDYLDLWETRL